MLTSITTQSHCLALDIGGANLKATDGGDYCRSMGFPLWKNPAGLPAALGELTADAPPVDRAVVTMTGELADCFRTKREGVAAILESVAAWASGGFELQVYLTDGTFVGAEAARRRWLEAAASNWHALASFVARRFAPATGVLIDIGSTTTDIIPFAQGRVVAEGKTDPERLATGELIYSGVVRSPVCGVLQSLRWRGRSCGVAQELFATTLDAYLLLGSIDENESAVYTADGRPASREFARDRLARCICADREMFDADDAHAAATAIRDAQAKRIGDALRRIAERQSSALSLAVVSGEGEFLAIAALEFAEGSLRVESLGAMLGREASRVAPAYALAHLAQGRT